MRTRRRAEADVPAADRTPSRQDRDDLLDQRETAAAHTAKETPWVTATPPTAATPSPARNGHGGAARGRWQRQLFGRGTAARRAAASTTARPGRPPSPGYRLDGSPPRRPRRHRHVQLVDLCSGESGGPIVVALHFELDLASPAAPWRTALGVIAARPGRGSSWTCRGLRFIDNSGIAALSRGRRRALAAPRVTPTTGRATAVVQRVLAILWEASGSDLPASVVKVAASARPPACGRADQRQPLRMRWRRIAMNAYSGAPSGDQQRALRRPPRASIPCRPPAGLAGKPPAVVTAGARDGDVAQASERRGYGPWIAAARRGRRTASLAALCLAAAGQLRVDGASVTTG